MDSRITEVRKTMKLNHYICIGAIVLIGLLVGFAPALSAGDITPVGKATEKPAAKQDKEGDSKLDFMCYSVRAMHKTFPASKGKDYVEFINIDDAALQTELKTHKGYNSFEAVNSHAADIGANNTAEYRVDEKQDIYCKIKITSVETLREETREGNVVVTVTFSINVSIVKRTTDDKGKSSDIVLKNFVTTAVLGKYRLIVYPAFFPAVEKEPARDLLLAIKAR